MPAGIVDLDPHDTHRRGLRAHRAARTTATQASEATEATPDGRRMVMLQQYDEAVEVRATGGKPEHFLWRGRLWRVCAVLNEWIETAAWWRTDPADVGWGPERSVFRVEAGSGRHARTETFDLAFDPTSDRRQVERVTKR